MIDNDTVATTARQLRLILDAIERGDLDAIERGDLDASATPIDAGLAGVLPAVDWRHWLTWHDCHAS